MDGLDIEASGINRVGDLLFGGYTNRSAGVIDNGLGFYVMIPNYIGQ